MFACLSGKVDVAGVAVAVGSGVAVGVGVGVGLVFEEERHGLLGFDLDLVPR